MTRKISLFQCSSCGRRWQSRYAGCPYCGTAEPQPIEVDGQGTVYSWVTVARPMAADSPPVPYSVVAVNLNAGARVFARFSHPEEPVPGEPVKVWTDKPTGTLRAERRLA